MNHLRELMGLQGESMVDAFMVYAGAGIACQPCCTGYFGQALGTVCSSFPVMPCLHGKLSVIISKWAVSSFRHN